MSKSADRSPWQEKLRRLFRTIVELSSVLTIFSFIASSLILFVTLMLNGVRFTDVVTVDDIVISGVNFAARWLWIFVVAVPIAFFVLSFFNLLLARDASTLRDKAGGWWRKLTALFFISFYGLIGLGLLVLGLFAAILGEASSMKAGESETVNPQLLVGAILVGWILVLGALWRNFAGKKLVQPSTAGPLDSKLILKLVLVYGGTLSLIAAFAERAWFSRSTNKLALSILVEPKLQPLCGTTSRRIVWIGTTTVVIRCGRRRVIVKGVENVIVADP
jgi:hypothetical protein